MAIFGYDIRVNGGGWMNVGNVLTKFIRGLRPADNIPFELRARDLANNVSTTAGPVYGTPTEVTGLFEHRENIGGGSVPPYVTEGATTGGGTSTFSPIVNIATLEDPAPDDVYETLRYAVPGDSFSFSRTVEASKRYLIRLHCHTDGGSRPTTVTVNGSEAITFNPFIDSGSVYALGFIAELEVEQGAGTSMSFVVSGDGVSYPALCGIEILEVPSIYIENEALPDATAGEAYSATLVAAGAIDGTAAFSIELGSLPTGLSLNAATGAITGTPTAIGLVGIVFKAEDDTNIGYRYCSLLVGEAPTAYLLDDLTSMPAVAVSLRKLRSAYAGPCIRVEKFDGTQQDIGFDSNESLDKAAALAFGTNLEVVAIYDQSTNGNDFVDYVDDRPTLNYDHFSGRPALDFGPAGVVCGLITDDSVSMINAQAYVVVNPIDTTGSHVLFELNDASRFVTGFFGGALSLYNSASVNTGRFDGGRAQITINYRLGDDRTFIDGEERPPLGLVTDATHNPGTGEIIIGRRSHLSGGGGGLIGYMSEALFYLDDTVSTDDDEIIKASQPAYWIPNDPPANKLTYESLVLLEGDSRTSGFNNTGDESPLDVPLRALLDSTWVVRNIANGGHSLIGHYIPQGSWQVDPYFNPTLTKNVVVVWGIVNDLAGDPGETLDAADLYAAMTTYIQARQAAGFEVVVCTDLPSTGYVTSNQENIITPAYNALVIANTAGADAVVDFSDDADLTDPNDMAYFTDGTHINDAAASKCAALIEAAILSL